MFRPTSKLSLSATVLASLILIGCETTGTGRAAAASGSAENLSAQFTQLDTQIDATLAALAEVPKNKEGDLKKHFDLFMAEMYRLETQGKKVVTAAADLKKNSKKYIEGWQSQMGEVESADLKEQGEQRIAEASAKFEDAMDELDRIKGDFDSFYGRINEIKIVLENDLNAAGVTGLEKAISTAGEAAGPVKEDIKEIVAGLARVSGSISSKAPADGK
ncbi:MAG: DUF2959 family protein [Planctomycetota bacterium]|jgi:outer membrane murein-binding lipoprotein Lpp